MDAYSGTDCNADVNRADKHAFASGSHESARPDDDSDAQAQPDAHSHGDAGANGHAVASNFHKSARSNGNNDAPAAYIYGVRANGDRDVQARPDSHGHGGAYGRTCGHEHGDRSARALAESCDCICAGESVIANTRASRRRRSYRDAAQ